MPAPGEPQRIERAFKQSVKKADHEAELGDAVVLGVFRKKVIDLATKDHTGFLADMDFDALGLEDANLFSMYEEGTLTDEIAQNNWHMLYSTDPEKSLMSRKFIDYLLYRLREDAKQKRSGSYGLH